VTAQLWTPGATGPLDDLVGRLARMVEAFGKEHGLEKVEVRIELADGSQHVLARIEPEPGFGFLSLVPYRQEGDEPRRLVVPVGAVRLIEMSTPDPARPFGFSGAPYTTA
jgi:hypothetical protein